MRDRHGLQLRPDDERISEVASKIHRATVEDIQSMGESVSMGLGTVDEPFDAFAEMVTDSEEVNQTVQEIDTTTDGQASSTKTVVVMIEEINSIS